MWPAYLAALLLSLPAPADPAAGGDRGPRSALDRPHRGEEAPQKTSAQLSRMDEDDEDEGEEEGQA